MRRLSVASQPIKYMFTTLQMASHKIRTAFGVSDKTYGPNRDPPLQGIGQGNGAGPAGWAVISTPLINMMRTAGFGFGRKTETFGLAQRTEPPDRSRVQLLVKDRLSNWSNYPEISPVRAPKV